VVFHGIRGHALKSGDFRIAEPVPHSFSYAPFRRRQEVVITGAAAALFWGHEAYVIRPDTYLPYPPPRSGQADKPPLAIDGCWPGKRLTLVPIAVIRRGTRAVDKRLLATRSSQS